jgi:ATP-binding cassette subfamily B protein
MSAAIAHDEHGEQIFSRFDTRVVSRLWSFVRPYRGVLVAAVLSVVAYTAVQVAIPVTVRHAIDSMLGHAGSPLSTVMTASAALVAFNGGLNFLQE